MDILSMIDEEIATLSAHVQRHQGVGAYHENCCRWREHIAAYQHLRERAVYELNEPNVTGQSSSK